MHVRRICFYSMRLLRLRTVINTAFIQTPLEPRELSTAKFFFSERRICASVMLYRVPMQFEILCMTPRQLIDIKRDDAFQA